MTSHNPDHLTPQRLATALADACPPDDKFASHDAALGLARSLLTQARSGDQLAQHTIDCTLRAVTR